MADMKTTSDGTGRARRGHAGKRLLRGLVVVLAVVAASYGTAAAYMYLNQRSFVFVPRGALAMPVDRGLEDVTAETVAMADGTVVTVWKAEAEPGKPTVLYFHGNSGNLSTRWKRFGQIVDSGYGLYAPTHRGYPGAGGAPSEAALISDGFEHFDRAAAQGNGVVVHGESLGTGIAAAVAAQRPAARLLVLEAPYTALVDMAADAYPWLPVGLLMKDPMPTRERIEAVEAPVLIVHGTADRVIPVEHGRRLFEAASEPKELLIVEGAGHGNLWDEGLWDAVRLKAETAPDN